MEKLKVKDQLEENGVLIDGKWAFNPIGIYKPKRKDLLNFMQDLDGTQACNRFEWVGCPQYLPSWLIEQMLYWRGSLCFFKQGTEFRLLPYVSSGKLDCYGLMTGVTPLPYNGGAIDEKELANTKAVYGELRVNSYSDKEENTNGVAVLLFDRFNGITKNKSMLPKAILQRTICQEIVNRLCFLNINLVNSQGKNIILVKDPKQAKVISNVLDNLYSSDKAYQIAKSMFEVQVINNEIKNDEQQIWEDAMSWNNLRLEGLGIKNNGLFQKKERKLVNETDTNLEGTNLEMDAYYMARKLFVNTIKEVFKDDEIFKRDFAKFDIIDKRQASQPSQQDEYEEEPEESDDYDNFGV